MPALAIEIVCCSITLNSVTVRLKEYHWLSSLMLFFAFTTSKYWFFSFWESFASIDFKTKGLHNYNDHGMLAIMVKTATHLKLAESSLSLMALLFSINLASTFSLWAASMAQKGFWFHVSDRLRLTRKGSQANVWTAETDTTTRILPFI